ncbi:unnamed protein product [Adineta steineri]|uniref:D-fructose-1,6-bisphosphate 1-phosphohydrolase n=1 Tax=Adineta steineri TaxID=433720 RepID=A0A815FJF2_9BILA|nr:unnamed protein product [Adineta steineri]
MVRQILIVLSRKYIDLNEEKDCFNQIFILIILVLYLAYGKKPDNVDEPIDCILQGGEHLRCSGYAVYGSACMLVLATQEGVNEKPFANRYVGSMVADVHRTLMYGGVFMYPATKEAQDGKIRLLYESIAMSYIVEKAGGASSNGQHSILKIQPQHIHQRSPVFLGYKEEIEKLYQQYPRHTRAHE